MGVGCGDWLRGQPRTAARGGAQACGGSATWVGRRRWGARCGVRSAGRIARSRGFGVQRGIRRAGRVHGRMCSRVIVLASGGALIGGSAVGFALRGASMAGCARAIPVHQLGLPQCWGSQCAVQVPAVSPLVAMISCIVAGASAGTPAPRRGGSRSRSPPAPDDTHLSTLLVDAIGAGAWAPALVCHASCLHGCWDKDLPGVGAHTPGRERDGHTPAGLV